MRALTGELLLAAWEQSMPENHLNRALTMLAVAMPESSRSQLAEMSVAERNLALLRLHELSFGSFLSGFSVCSQCGGQLEFTLQVSPMLAQLENQAPKAPAEWSENGQRYRLRPANTSDLLSSLEVPDTSEAQNHILARCLTLSGEQESIPPSVLYAALEKFEQLHEAAELNCAIQCPECSGNQTFDLDIVRFLWCEVRYAAQRLLSEIHQLAGAYGWSEQSIARMSPQRRGAYLEMLSA
jgi:hypothetical protein